MINNDLTRFIDLKSSEFSRGKFYGKMIRPKHHNSLPKKIYFYWDKGLDQAPDIVKACYRSWVSNNESWEVKILSEKEALDILGYKKSDKCIAAHYADELRMKILYLDGGIWVDSTVFCSMPLDYWLPNIFNQTDFFAFFRPTRDRIISNWFIASNPGSQLISGWHDMYFQYLSDCTSNRPYFVHHWIFEYLLRTSTKHLQEFESMPKISAEPLHFLQVMLKSENLSKSALARLKVVPMHKLSYKFPDKINLNSLTFALDLLSRIK